MPEILDYALLSTRVYAASDRNRTGVPAGWTEQRWEPDYNLSGFSAGAYRKGSEVVIAYTGTNQKIDWVDDILAGTGILPAPQVFDAMRFYLDVKAANPGATITFTGHSLGGGLASLMSVFFDKPALVFDEAPFQLTAINPLILTSLQASLLLNGYTDLDFALYNASFGTLFPFREGNVSHIYLEGEELGGYRNGLNTIVGPAETPVSMGSSTLGTRDRHDMTLLTAMWGNPAFASVVRQLPDLAIYLLDPAWFGATDRRTPGTTDLLSTLLLRQYGDAAIGAPADGRLDRFAADMQQLVSTAGAAQSYAPVRNALMIAAMEYYAAKVTTAADHLFTVDGNGLHFKYSDIGAASYKSLPLLARTVESLLGPDGTDTYDRLITQNAWHIQSGTAGMTWTAIGAENDAAIGGAQADTLNAGAGNDVLCGLGGTDILNGGAGADLMIGGEGVDTYVIEGNDTIRDSDGNGNVYFNGTRLTGGIWSEGDPEGEYKGDGGIYRVADGGILTFSKDGQTLSIEDFDNRELGIYLDTEEDANDADEVPPKYNPNNSIIVRRVDPLVLDLDGNGQIDAVGSTASTIYFDFNGDGISEKAGWIAPQDGLLALDANDNGTVDNLSELFGSTQLDGFAELAGHDSNTDGVIDARDTDFVRLKVWQDANQDGISQSNEFASLEALGITSIGLGTSPTNIHIEDNLLTATGSFTRDGEEHLIADINLAINFAQTDSNPTRPLGQFPQLDPEVFDLPWLRGCGNVKSLHVACQENPTLRQAASDLVTANDWRGILSNFDGFMAQWTGLAQAHADHGVVRTGLTIEDKAWMLENLTGQDVYKSAIEAANFGAISSAGRTWNIAYIDNVWNNFLQHEALSFVIQTETKDWLSGVSYSLNNDRFVATDATRLQQSLLDHLNNIANTEDAAFAAIVLSRLKRDGVALDAEGIKQSLTETPYSTLFNTVLDNTSENIYGHSTGFVINFGNGILAQGMGGADSFSGGTGNDILDGGAGNDNLGGELATTPTCSTWGEERIRSSTMITMWGTRIPSASEKGLQRGTSLLPAVGTI